MNDSSKACCTKAVAIAFVAIIVLTLGHVWVQRFACDDAAILWRYAKHVAEGHGFRYNIEDPLLEGTSNPPFCAVMAGSYAAGIDPEHFTWGSGLVFAAVTLLLIYALGRRMGLSPWLALGAPLALALNHSFASWATGGLGSRFYTMFVVLALLRFLREETDETRSRIPSSLLFGWVALIRPEGVVWFGLAFVWRALHRPGFAALVRFAIPFVLVKLAQVGVYMAYFGSPLPNTAYAKVNGIWLDRGLWFLSRLGLTYTLWLVLPFALLGCISTREREARPTRFVLFSALGFALSLAMIGGGRHEFRLMDPVFPLLYVAGFGGVSMLVALGRQPWILAGVPALLIVLSSAAGTLVRRSEGIYVREFPAPTEDRPDKMARWIIVDVEYLKDFYEAGKRDGLLLKKHFPPETRIAQRAAGATPLYSELYTLDVHGLNDPIIARRPTTDRGTYAHEKMAIPADFDRAEVDYILIHKMRQHPVLDLAERLGVRHLVEHWELDPDAIPAPVLPLLKLDEHKLIVRLEESVWIYAHTRLPATSYREDWVRRGYTVLH